MGNSCSFREKKYTKNEVKEIVYNYVNDQITKERKSKKTNKMIVKYVVCY